MPRILVIDDDSQTRAVLQQMLERAGYEVVEASNGHEGLQRYRIDLPDLVITDILMPEQEGLETIQALRRASPDVKIIAISGGGKMGLLDILPIAAKFGAQCTLQKPLRRQELLEAVRQLLQGQSPQTDAVTEGP